MFLGRILFAPYIGLIYLINLRAKFKTNRNQKKHFINLIGKPRGEKSFALLASTLSVAEVHLI